MSYSPFAYPPNYQIARLHRQTTRPGFHNESSYKCLCCNNSPNLPFSQWFSRSIDDDFSRYGGAVVGYFWLLKLYIYATAIIFLLYSSYLWYVVSMNCSAKQPLCSNIFGIQLISNSDLYLLLRKKDDRDTLLTLSILRSITFLLLLFFNAFSLHLIRKVKHTMPMEQSVASFSLVFQNVKITQEELALALGARFKDVRQRDVLMVQRLQPYYGLNKKKMKLYYKCRIEENIKVRNKMIEKLIKIQEKCMEWEKQIQRPEGSRCIVTFASQEERDFVMSKYKIQWRDKIKMYFSSKYQQEFKMFCEECPRPEEILWNNFGKRQTHNNRMKITSVIYFFLLLILSFLILYFLLQILYLQPFPQPYQTVVQTIILLFMVVIARIFRLLMDHLSQSRHPNTFTSRTMFIVVTTIVFHFVFYLAIPILYLTLQTQRRGDILKLIVNQTATFLIVQIVLSGMDLMHCCWKKGLKRIQDQKKPLGCQKMLNQAMQFPRFPIQFKLIVLFKIWSFVIFFGYQVPIVVFIMLLTLIFVYIKDKHSLYYHYRMQVIDCKVQYSFLRIYSNFFSVFMCLVFMFTQRLQYELYIAGVITFAVIIVQSIYFRQFQKKKSSAQLIETCYDDLNPKMQYRVLFKNFVENLQSKAINEEIRQYLSKILSNSTRTEQILVINN